MKCAIEKCKRENNCVYYVYLPVQRTDMQRVPIAVKWKPAVRN